MGKGSENRLSARASLAQRVNQLLGREWKPGRSEDIDQECHIIVGQGNRAVHALHLFDMAQCAENRSFN